jgi:capsular exopolysaccharide synthesis family protein
MEPNSPVTSHNGYQNGHNAQSTPQSYGPAYVPQDDLDLGQITRIVRRRGLLIAGVAIAVTASIWGWTLTRTPIYRGEFRVLVDAEDETSQILQDPQLQIVTQFDFQTQIEVLRSPALLEPIAQRLQSAYPSISYGSLVANLGIGRVQDTKVMAVSFLDPNPQKIERVLEALSEEYLRYSFQQRQSSLKQGIDFVDEQLPELRERVNTLQVQLERFRQQYSLLDPESRGGDLSGLISSVEQQLQETETQLSEVRSLYNTLQRQLGYGPSEALAASTLSESNSYQNILSQIQEIEAQIATESARFLPDSPQILVLEDERNSLLPLLEQEAGRLLRGQPTGVDDNLTPTSLELSRDLIQTANQLQVLEAKRDALANVEAQLKEEFELVPALARQYTDLQRELTIATDSLNRFLETRETLQLDAAQQSVPWELISKPSVSLSPISPNIPRNLMLGAIAGLMLGSAAALLAEKLDTAFHSAEELKRATNLPLLGMIPYTKALQETNGTISPNVAEAPSEEMEATTTTTTRTRRPYSVSPFFESFRSLYANLRFLSSDAPIRSLVISSAAPAEGKSTTAFYLARAAAAMGQRVLLVDADLRRPQLHVLLEVPNLRGLSNVLTSELPLSQVVQRVTLAGPDDDAVADLLYVLPAGPVPPDPVKLLSSRRMQSLMHHLQTQFDLIIYDMPPLVGFADGTVLANHTDGMVMVVGLGRTDRSSLMQALESVKLSPVTILGLVANGIKSHTSHSHYGYYRYNYYYGRYGDNDSRRQRHGHGNGSHHHSSRPGHHSETAALVTRSQQAVTNLWQSLTPRTKLMMFVSAGMIGLFLALGWNAYQRLIELPEAAPPTPLPSPEEGTPTPSPETTADSSPGASPAATAEESAADPFAEAVRIAEDASVAGQTAMTQEEWEALQTKWLRAAELMTQVPSTHDQFATAQDRIILYELNAEYARQKAESAAFTEASEDSTTKDE